MSSTLFSSGEVVATANALRAMEYNEVTPQSLIRRHEGGDWGEMQAEDGRGNEQRALALEGDITSRYRLDDGEIVLVMTSFQEDRTIISQPGDDEEIELWASQRRGALQDDVAPIAPYFLVPIVA